MIINTLIVLFSIVYFLSVMVFLSGLFQKKSAKNSTTPFISVVIALKNEETNLDILISGLKKQDYPADRYEVILVDNDSDDDTHCQLEKMVQTIPNFTVLSTKNYHSDLQYKKEALMMGIEKSHGEIILSTDADCQVQPTWISGFAKNYTDDVDMAVGFSEVDERATIFQKFQKFDFMMLMAAAKGAMNLGCSWGGSGQNISFRKKAFYNCNGYNNLKTLKGGDDTLFIQKFAKYNSGKIIFAPNKETWVKTRAVNDFFAFMRQRIRWASEAKYTQKFNRVVFLISLGTFVANAGLVFLLITSIFRPENINLFGILFLGKAFVEFVLARTAAKTFQINRLLAIFPLWFVIYPSYVLFLGLTSFKGHNIKWK